MIVVLLLVIPVLLTVLALFYSPSPKQPARPVSPQRARRLWIVDQEEP